MSLLKAEFPFVILQAINSHTLAFQNDLSTIKRVIETNSVNLNDKHSEFNDSENANGNIIIEEDETSLGNEDGNDCVNIKGMSNEIDAIVASLFSSD